MKNFIEKSGLTETQFAKKYDIPYNTVRQWAKGIRKAPAWLIKLFESEQAYKPHIEDKKPDCMIYEYYANNTLKYRAFLPKEATEEQIEWFNSKQKKYKDYEEELTEKRIYKAYLYYIDIRSKNEI